LPGHKVATLNRCDRFEEFVFFLGRQFESFGSLAEQNRNGLPFCQGFTLDYDLSIDDSAGSDFHGAYLTPEAASLSAGQDDDAERRASPAGTGGTPVTVRVHALVGRSRSAEEAGSE
jgi:hypothetical protein